MENPRSQQAAVVLWAALVEGGMALLAWGLGLLMERPLGEQFRLAPPMVLWHILGALLCTLPLLPPILSRTLELVTNTTSVVVCVPAVNRPLFA